MPRKATALTATRVKTAPPGRYGDGNGLYLLVRSAEARFWLFRYTRAGKMREMGLGRAGADKAAVTLAAARDRAAALHRLVKDGRDPLADRDEAAAAEAAAKQEKAIRATTFRMVAERHLEANRNGWRNQKHRQQWENTLATYVYPHFGNVPVGDVGVAHIMAALEPIWHTKAETAARVRGRIEAVLDAAAVDGLREGLNPARWRGHLAKKLPPRSKVAPQEHHPALPWKDMAGFMVELHRQGGMAAIALRFTILTWARSGEALGARWSEIDLDAKVWTVPAARTKAKRDHRVPLSTSALTVLREVALLRPADGSDAFLFPGAGTRALSNMAMTVLLRRMKRGDITVHGMRSAARDFAGEATNTPREVAEAALAHTLGKTEAAYARGDLFEKRRKLMDEWAAHCAGSAG